MDSLRFASTRSGRRSFTGPDTIFMRRRYQLGGALLFAIFLPIIIRSVFTGVPVFVPSSRITAVGATLAVVFGYIGYKRLDLFPKMDAGRSILPALSTSFGLVAVTFLLLRLQYSGVHFLIAYVVSVIWFSIVELIARKRGSFTLAIVPGGISGRLFQIPGIQWINVPSPDAPRDSWNGIIADLHADLSPEWERMIADCALNGLPVFHVKQVIEQLTGRVEIRHISENTLGSLNPDQAYFKIKAAADWALAVAALILIGPFLALIALAIRIDSPGPALFRQTRTGLRGEPFTMFKLRTMKCESGDRFVDSRNASITCEGDQRITKIGRFLRRTRIDELPQIINILRGEMSWIGPRPEAVPLTRWYEAELPFYHYRHIVRPGITGWAQVNQGHVAEIDDVREKLHYDFYYIKNFSFWLDVITLLKTMRIVVTGHGAK